MKKVLFVSRVSLFPPEHGGAKMVRSLISKFAAEGVECRTLVRQHPPAPQRIRFAGQRSEDLPQGPEFRAVTDLARELAQEIELFRPDAVVVSDDSLDDASSYMNVAADSGRMVFLATTIHCLPFGPFSIGPSPATASAIKRAARIVAPSQHVADYFSEHLGRESTVLYSDVFGEGPFRALGRRDNRFVTMINPCAWKGGSIFAALAKARPDLEFAAVPTWGATEAMLDELRALPNVTLLKETTNIDEIYGVTRVLLAPSLCQEAFGLVSPEALLRGIPVIASRIAGLKESTLGQARLIDVNAMPFDRPPVGTGPHDFVWNVPENDVTPWSNALDAILKSETAYDEASRTGKAVAEAFVTKLRTQRVTESFI